MISKALLLIGVLAAGGPQAAAPRGKPSEDEALARVARGVSGRLVMVEVVRSEGGKETVVLSQPGLVIGPKSVLALSPRLAKVSSAAGSSVRIAVDEAGGKSRSVPAKLLKTDPQTGLGVLSAEDLGVAVAGCTPAPAPKKDAPVFLVEPRGSGNFIVRRGIVLQARAYLDQGRGKNPLLLVKLTDGEMSDGRSYSRWDDDRVSGSGVYLADAAGGFLGLVKPPVLEDALPEAPRQPFGAEKADSEKKKESSRPKLREGELLALPGEVTRYLSTSLAQGKAPLRGYLGASFRDVADPPEEVRRLGLAPAVRVEKVYPGGPADEGGLQPGDWLLAIEEKRKIAYADLAKFSELVEYGGQGKAIHFLVARGNSGALHLQKLKIQIGWR